VLVEKTARAAREQHAKSVLVSGGVAANRLLRRRLAARIDLPLYIPEPQFCTDNAAMIAGAAYHVLRRGVSAGPELDVRAQFPWSDLPGARVIERAGA
jgi:N6-L-threonylcarbamoyladenine synthase